MTTPTSETAEALPNGDERDEYDRTAFHRAHGLCSAGHVARGPVVGLDCRYCLVALIAKEGSRAETAEGWKLKLERRLIAFVDRLQKILELDTTLPDDELLAAVELEINCEYERATTAERALAEKEAELAKANAKAELAKANAKAEKWALAEGAAINANIRIGAELASAMQELAGVKAERDHWRATFGDIYAAVRGVARTFETTPAPPAVETPGATGGEAWSVVPDYECIECLGIFVEGRSRDGEHDLRCTDCGHKWSVAEPDPTVPEVAGAKLCGIPARSLPPCDLPWGHDGDMHANGGDGFYARDHLEEHHRRQREFAEVVGAKCPECRGTGTFVVLGLHYGSAGTCSACHGTGQSQPSPAVLDRTTELVELSRSAPVDREAQRRSFAYGNLAIEEQPHPGRAGEAIDALERHLRASQPATETGYPDFGVDPRDSESLLALRDAIDDHLGWENQAEEDNGDYLTRIRQVGELLRKPKPDHQPVEGVSDEELQAIWLACDGIIAPLRKVYNLGASRSSAAKDARIAELEARVRFFDELWTSGTENDRDFLHTLTEYKERAEKAEKATAAERERCARVCESRADALRHLISATVRAYEDAALRIREGT